VSARSNEGAPVNPASLAAARRSQRWIWAWVALGLVGTAVQLGWTGGEKVRSSRRGRKK